MFAINPLSVLSFANISYSLGWLFTLLMVSYAVQMLSLIRFHLIVFAFVSFALGNRSKKILEIYVSVLAMFFSTSFVILSSLFRSVTCFKLIF